MPFTARSVRWPPLRLAKTGSFGVGVAAQPTEATG